MRIDRVGYMKGGVPVEDYGVYWQEFEAAQPVRLKVVWKRSGWFSIIGIDAAFKETEVGRATSQAMLKEALTHIQEHAKEHLTPEALLRSMERAQVMRDILEAAQLPKKCEHDACPHEADPVLREKRKRAFWARTKDTAHRVEAMPDWKKAGLGIKTKKRK